MRRFITSSFAVLTMCVLSSTIASQERISFYEVPLECGAAPDIGCGSRAKPALLEMEKNPAIKEAWLNREGTVYAVVWAGRPQTGKAAKPIFKKHAIEFKELGGGEKAEHLQNFRQEGKWYRGAAVDQLSLEEAERIGNTIVDMLLPGDHVTEEEAKVIQEDVTTYFKEELVKIRTYEELRRDSEMKFQERIIAVIEKHLGKQRTDKIVELFGRQKE
ncbi:MAG: hypothetical protein L0Z48_01065 [candidate division Zixibacteria bacterium]|nr:hypothetical protein [candidate division Zixibacteria bacterium]MCI0595113.1 hypothetical protein [candidate division Zixibacteria bacterium]